jgi:hypothetical protein
VPEHPQLIALIYLLLASCSCARVKTKAQGPEFKSYLLQCCHIGWQSFYVFHPNQTAVHVPGQLRETPAAEMFLSSADWVKHI